MTPTADLARFIAGADLGNVPPDVLNKAKVALTDCLGCALAGARFESSEIVLDYLRDGGKSTTLNCGYGHGYSVREVLAAVEKANSAPLQITEEPRRAGDPPELVAVASKIRSVLGWAPKFDDLDTIVSTSLAWERRIASQDPTAYWAA